MGITRTCVVDDGIERVFAWHERPGAFTRLSPPGGPVALREEADSVADGRAVLALPGGLRWVAQHRPDAYHPPRQFVDELVSSPLRYLTPWRHTHGFESIDQETTRIVDRVRTPIPAPALAPMFTYRHRQLIDDIRTQKWARDLTGTPLTIGVTGASGTIGSAFAALATTGGHRVISLVRRAPRNADERRWEPLAPAPDVLDGVDAVVHLAGAPIVGRFTDGHLRRVRDSRVGPTELLAQCAARAAARGNGPSTFVSASAIGVYGDDRGDEELTEQSPPGSDDIAGIVVAWEAACAPAVDAGIRVAMVRTGVVQSAAGGALAVLRPMFAVGLGGRIGDGAQWTSWIAIDDACDVFYRAVLDPRVRGPVNAVAPHPVRNREYAATLGHVLHRPVFLRVPEVVPNAALTRDGARSLVLADHKVAPAALTDLGHHFRFPDLSDALAHQLLRSSPDPATA